MIIRRGNPGGPGNPGAGGRTEFEQTRRTPAGLGQPVVELVGQKVLQRNHCADTYAGAHQGQQNYLRDEQPRPK